VKECLLESADQDFWVHNRQGASIHVMPPTKITQPMGEEIVAPYDKSMWGKGILNIRRALQYAALKAENPNANPQVIRQHLDRQEAKEANEAAIKIQRLFRRKPVAGGGAAAAKGN
jgi:hypothetical protein